MRQLIIIVMLMTLMGSAAFAVQSTEIVDDSFEIIEPALGDSSRVIVKDQMLISIRFLEEKEARLNLFKVEEVLPEFEEVTFDNATGTSVNVFDLVNDETWVSFDENDEGEFELTYADTDERTKREEIILRYFELKRLMERLEADRISLRSEINLSESSEELMSSLGDLEEKLLIVRSDYHRYRGQYQNLFRVPVLENVAVQKEGILPYFTTTVERIEAGQYELELRSMEDRRLYRKRFTVERSDALSSDLSGEDADQQLKRIFLPAEE